MHGPMRFAGIAAKTSFCTNYQYLCIISMRINAANTKAERLPESAPLCVAGIAAEVVPAVRPGPGQTAGARGLGGVP